MGLTSTGIGSGLDINSLVTQLMNVEKQPLQLIQQRQDTVNAQISAYGQLQSQVASFGDSAALLGAASTMATYAANIADTEVGSATASSSAVAGSYSLEVRQLAQVEKVSTASQPGGATTVMGTGDVTLTLGAYDSGANTFTADGSKTPLTLHLTAGNNTLTGIRDAINAANQGFTASIVTDASGSRLVVSSAATGAKNAIRISAPTIAALDFDPTSTGTQSVTRLQSAQDAKIRLDTLDIVSSSNQVSGAIEGVTLSLAKAKPGTTTAITVGRDTSKPTSALTTFVSAYNSLNALVREMTKYDATTKVSGTLQGEVTAQSLQTQMRSMVATAVPGGASDIKTLNEIGITLQTDGSLKLDTVKLSTVMSTPNGAAQVARLFIAPTGTTASATTPDTYATRIKSFVDRMQGTGGILPSKVQGLQATARQLTKQTDDFNTRMTTVEARLKKQFNALDANIASQNAITSYLTNQELAWQAAAKQN